jgi:SagB-type dehydrogenase family enzyme
MSSPDRITLPAPDTTGIVTLEDALAHRRSIRSFTEEKLTTVQAGQLLWAAQGVTRDDGKRTAPSAGATLPLETLAVTADGVYRYRPSGHALDLVRSGDLRRELAGAAGGQWCVESAALIVAVAAVRARIEPRYRDRADDYTWLEAGHAAQNVLLEAVALGLGAVPVGWFTASAVDEILRLEPGERTLYLVPVGHPAEGA